VEEETSTRRNWLRMGAAAGASAIFVSRRANPGRLVPAATAVDHLLLGVGDLDRGIEWLRKTTGVKAVAGGSHPGVGTRNALVSLGGRRYLEILAPDPEQAEYEFRIDVRKLEDPRLITWAAGSDQVDAVAKRARDAGCEILGPQEGSRARPDGKLLRWRTVAVKNDLGAAGVEPIPFFIEWARDSTHPSRDSPRGCALAALQIEHPNPGAVADLLAKLGIEATVERGDEVRLKAALRTPQGDLRLD